MDEIPSHLLPFIEAHRFLSIMNPVVTADKGFNIIRDLCDECIENRDQACEKCKVLHKELDGIESIMPRDILFEQYCFIRTKVEKDRILENDNRISHAVPISPGIIYVC